MADKVQSVDTSDDTTSLIMTFLKELFTSPVNVALLGVCAYLLYKIFSGRRQEDPGPPPEPALPPMKKRDFTLEQLREYDGRGVDGRILIAVNGKVFDVTRGKRFYGPGKKNQEIWMALPRSHDILSWGLVLQPVPDTARHQLSCALPNFILHRVISAG